MADPQYRTLQVGDRTKTRVSESSEIRVSDQRLRLVNSKDWTGGLLEEVDMEAQKCNTSHIESFNVSV